MRVNSRVIFSGICLILSFLHGTKGVPLANPYSAPDSDPRRSTMQAADKTNQANWGDQGNGTYANPVLPGDFSDLDVIRVGRSFYAISSTLQYSPGVLILHSMDLVNWKIIGHVVNDLSTLDPELNWDRMNRSGRGVWAGAVRFHHGKFWVYFGTPDQGIFMTTASNATGPWTSPQPVLRGGGWDDPCPFWDDDETGYLVATHFAPEGPSGTTYNIHLFRLSPDGDRVLEDSDHIIHRSEGSEANKFYKIHGIYYHYYSEVAPEGRVAMIERSSSLSGPWEVHQLIHVNAAVDKEPNQGGLVQSRSGKWYFLSHQGYGDWEGRAGVLLPVTWIKGWPIIGRVGPDGIGNMVWRSKKPVIGFPFTDLAASDSFDSPILKPEWEWNYQPRAEKWSLKDHPGFLRLNAFQPLHANDLKAVGNVLTQRAYRSSRNQVTVKLDVSRMLDGQEAGLVHFAKTSCALEVDQTGQRRALTYNCNGKKVTGPTIFEKVICLRSTWGYKGLSQFSYSTDGRRFLPFGDTYQLTWDAYRGDRVGIFTDNPNTAAGYVDVDSFQYSIRR